MTTSIAVTNASLQAPFAAKSKQSNTIQYRAADCAVALLNSFDGGIRDTG